MSGSGAVCGQGRGRWLWFSCACDAELYARVRIVLGVCGGGGKVCVSGGRGSKRVMEYENMLAQSNFCPWGRGYSLQFLVWVCGSVLPKP